MAAKAKENLNLQDKADGKSRKSAKLRQLHEDQSAWLAERLLPDSEVRKGSLEWRLAKRERYRQAALARIQKREASDEAQVMGEAKIREKEEKVRAKKREYMRRYRERKKLEALEGKTLPSIEERKNEAK